MLEKESLLETFIELCGYGEIKPFECVGTFEEVRFCVNKIIKEYNQDDLPFLLKYYKNNFEIENNNSFIPEEEYYCARCFKKISEEEYEMNDCMCEVI